MPYVVLKSHHLCDCMMDRRLRVVLSTYRTDHMMSSSSPLGLSATDTVRRDRSAPGLTTRTRILIVRPSALGDVSRTVAALVTIRRAFPHAQIDWMVNALWSDVIAHHPDLDDVIPFPRQRFANLHRSPRVMAEAWTWARDLRAKRYDIVFDLQGLFRSGLVTLLTAAPRRVGFRDARECGWLGYTHRHQIDGGLHTVDRMLGLLKADGMSPCHDMRLYVGSEDERWADAWLAEHLSGEPVYTCIAPTAKWLSKCWPIENYSAIARRLIDSQPAGRHLVILAATSEGPRVQPLIDALGDASDRVLFPRTTVGQMMALIRRCSLVVCNDSAALHIAVGLDRPAVAIFGPTDPRLVGPYRRPDSIVVPRGRVGFSSKPYRHLRDDQSLIAQVSVEQVWGKVLEQLQRSS